MLCKAGLYNSVFIATMTVGKTKPYGYHGNTIFKVMLLLLACILLYKALLMIKFLQSTMALNVAGHLGKY